MEMTIGSMATGAGGLDMAVTALYPDATHSWMSEIDPHASQVLAHRYPNVPNVGDLLAADLEPVDILVGGLPCQPYSVAGNQKGADDERDLIQHLPRIVSDLGPRLVLLEESPNLLNFPIWGTVVGQLAEIGYDVRWRIVAAADVGASHSRHRVFVVAYPHGRPIPQPHVGPQARIKAPRRSHPVGRHMAADWRVDGRPVGPAIARWEAVTGVQVPPPDHNRNWCPRFGEWMMGWPIGWVSDLVPALHARRIIGNGVVPQQAEWAFRSLMGQK